jgi:hypothetical protein
MGSLICGDNQKTQTIDYARLFEFFSVVNDGGISRKWEVLRSK